MRDEPQTPEEAVAEHYRKQMAAARERERRERAEGWRYDAGHERALKLRDSGEDGRRGVEQAYGASWDLAWYESGKQAHEELARREEKDRG